MANHSGPPHKKRRYGDHASSSTYDDSFGIQSLPVASLPDDFSGDPIDGEQYLAIVRREASAAPGVFFAEHNPYAAPSILLEEATLDPTISLPPPLDDAKTPTKEETLLMPSLEWRTAFELQFRNAKEALSNPPIEQVKLTKDDLPKIGNHNAWYAWIHGRPPPSPPGEAASTKTHEWRTKDPTPALLLRLNTEQILGLLEAFPYWLAHRVPIPDSQASITSTTSGSGGNQVIQLLHARWIFALLLKLDGRLVSEEISTLRTLARACVAAITLARIRRKAVQSKKARNVAENEAEDEDQRVEKEERDKAESKWRKDEAGAWMIVAIVAGVWGQQDLWDDAAVDMRRVT